MHHSPGTSAQYGVCPSTRMPPRAGPTSKLPKRSAKTGGSGRALGGVSQSRSRCRRLVGPGETCRHYFGTMGKSEIPAFSQDFGHFLRILAFFGNMRIFLGIFRQFLCASLGRESA
jgi:hypothetical protein